MGSASRPAATARAVAVAVTAALALGGAGGAQSAPQALRSPDGAAACVVRRDGIVCSNRSSQARAVPLAIAMGGTPDPRVVRTTVHWDRRTPLLRAGTSRKLGGYTCRAGSEELSCTDDGGNVVVVSGRRIAVLLAPANWP
jgi:hypothetical protein